MLEQPSSMNSNEFVNPMDSLNSDVEDTQRRRAAMLNVLTSVGDAETNAPAVDPTPAHLDLGKASRSSQARSGGGPLGSFLQAIAEQESGGNYTALGVVTRSGDRAYGKYQVMGANIPSWTKAALGKRLTPQEYLHSPKAQESVARFKLTQYFKKYGAAGAAKAWYAGEGNANTNSDRPQYGGPSINDYAAEVLGRM